MRPATLCLALAAAALCLQGCQASFFGLGKPRFKSVLLPKLSFASALPAEIPLAEGLTLEGKTAYVKTQPVPASTCLTIALGLFTDCQPFVRALIEGGGELSKPTLLQILIVAQNRTARAECFQATGNFLNGGCACDLRTSQTINALPDTSVPQLVKQFFAALSQRLCPDGLVSSGPPAPTAGGATPTTPTCATGTTPTGPDGACVPAGTVPGPPGTVPTCATGTTPTGPGGACVPAGTVPGAAGTVPSAAGTVPGAAGTIPISGANTISGTTTAG